MERIKLPNSELTLSPLTVGCWSFGGDKESYWGEQNTQDMNDVVHFALEKGINCFDTAIIYNNGASETALGHVLKGIREQVVIIDKIPIRVENELPHFEKTVADSLKKLDTDYIDIMMIHWPVRDVDLLRANLEALKKIQEKGMVRHVGVSNFGVGTLKTAEEMGIQVALNEVAYNLITRAIELEILPYCERNNIAVATYMPLMQGLLSGKYKTLESIPQNRRRTYHFDSANNPLTRHGGPGAEPELEIFLSELYDLSQKTGIDSAKLALAWIRAEKNIATIIVGCRNRRQLEENLQAVNTVLSSDVIKELDRISAPLRDKIGNNADLWQCGKDQRVW